MESVVEPDAEHQISNEPTTSDVAPIGDKISSKQKDFASNEKSKTSKISSERKSRKSSAKNQTAEEFMESESNSSRKERRAEVEKSTSA